MNLQNAVIVVTGAARGLGAALARVLHKRGATVIVTDRLADELEHVATELGATPMVCDVTKEQQVLDVADRVKTEFGKLDVWINNAGIWIPHAPADEMNLNGVHDMFEVNTFGTIHGCRAALRVMKPQHHGMIVNILSMTVLGIHPGSSGYAASKHAATGFTQVLRAEVQPEISVLSVYPDGMKTALFGEHGHAKFDQFMNPLDVAEKIVQNLEQQHPADELRLDQLS